MPLFYILYKTFKLKTKDIMRKNYLLFATAAMLAVSCANDDFAGKDSQLPTGDGSIAFNMNMPSMSRAGSSDDANKLGGMFIVWGEKNEDQNSGATADAANTVFQNYVVKYTENTAKTTTSNTNNWEYVGIDHSKYDTNVKNTIGSGKAQTIKYWDDQASSYTFTAISALEDDINAGNVKITKNTGSSVDGATVYDKGYTVEVGANATTGSIYFSDRKNIEKGQTGYTHAAVEMTFRNFMSKIRFGIFENIEGYKVAITGLKYTTASGENPTETTHTNGSTETDGTKFGITGDFVVTGANTKYTVTYEKASSSNPNKAKVEIAEGSNKQTYLETKGTTWLSTSADSPVGTTANAPTWDNANGSTGTYTTILPNPSNETNLKLQISYKLISEDTGEEIMFKDGGKEIFRTVEVPAQYCTWKSNYAYTYLFKITDKSAELNPITFDAVVIADETGKQETITTESETSITTYVNGKQVSNADEYSGGDVIYAYAQDGTLTAAMTDTNMKLYKVTAESGYAITEGSVYDALNNKQEGVTKKLTVTEIESTGTDSDKPSYEAILAEDGTTRTITGMKWTATAGTTYAIEYIKSGADNKKYYKVVKVKSN